MSTEENINSLPEQTPEQITAERFERYQKNPDQFIELKDVVMACVKSTVPNAELMVFVGQYKRSLLAQAKTEMDYAVHKHFVFMETRAAEATKQIITPGGGGNGGILNFARRHKQ
jgi:hypothetical protein